MTLKTLMCCAVLAAAAFAAWSFRDSPLARQVLPGAAAATASTASTAGLHKCRSASAVLYTDGACPPGSRPEAVAGALTVLPGQRPEPAASAAPHSVLRALAQPAPGPSLQEQRMEKVIGQ